MSILWLEDLIDFYERMCLIVQVREIAAGSISGLIRCGFIKSVPKLQVSEGVEHLTIDLMYSALQSMSEYQYNL